MSIDNSFYALPLTGDWDGLLDTEELWQVGNKTFILNNLNSISTFFSIPIKTKYRTYNMHVVFSLTSFFKYWPITTHYNYIRILVSNYTTYV